jgi:hypothetical protein
MRQSLALKKHPRRNDLGQPMMFELWKLKHKKSELLRQLNKEISTIEMTGNPPGIIQHFSSMVEQLERLTDEIQSIYDRRLLGQAQRLDIEPPSEESAWKPQPKQNVELILFRVLTPSGRISLRRRIDEEKTRRREVNAWWWKNVIIPAITALTGLAGVITGMIAVIHAKK